MGWGSVCPTPEERDLDGPTRNDDIDSTSYRSSKRFDVLAILRIGALVSVTSCNFTLTSTTA
jgi:hypothetical protein